jgi:hypothetical protein
VYAGVQLPVVAPAVEGVQTVEQQSFVLFPMVHESKSVLHCVPPGSAAHAFVVVPGATGSQPPVQQSPSFVQVWPSCLHEPLAHSWVTGSQAIEQHSPEVVQLPPAGVQNWPPVHLAGSEPSPSGSWHTVEQHSLPDVQSTPLPLQVVVGEAQRLVLGSQWPLQQSPSVAHETVSAAHRLVSFVQTWFAQAFVQQSAAVLHVAPTALQEAAATHWFPAQPRFSPAQQSETIAQVPPRCAHVGGWQVRWPDDGGQTSPAQQSASDAQKAVAIPHAWALVQTPPVQLSLFRQQPVVGPQAPPVAPQSEGATHVPPEQESAPRQQGWVASQPEAPVATQLALGVQTPLTHPSAPLQQAIAPPQAAPVPAQATGPAQTPPVQVCAELQHVPQAAPVPPQLPDAPVQNPPEQVTPFAALQQVVPTPHASPRAAHVGAVQTLLVQVSFASQQVVPRQDALVAAHGATQCWVPSHTPPLQQGKVAQDAPRLAQVAGASQSPEAAQTLGEQHDPLEPPQDWASARHCGVPPSLGLEPPPEHAARARAAANARDVNAGRAMRDMAFPSSRCGSNREETIRTSACRCSGVGFRRARCALAARLRGGRRCARSGARLCSPSVARSYRECWRRFSRPRPLPGPGGSAPRVNGMR